MRHTLSVLVENKFGVLSRVAGLFSARGYNIESLSVGETLDPSVSRMTLVVRGDAFVIEQVIKQLEGSGKVVAGGAMIGHRAGCVIVDVDSNEELADLLEPLTRARGETGVRRLRGLARWLVGER